MSKYEKDENIHTRNERVIASWSRHVGVLTYFIAGSAVAGVLISAINAYIVRGQLSAMREQDEITKAQIGANLRIIPPFSPISPVISKSGVQNGWILAPIIRNDGATEARNVLYGWEILVTPPISHNYGSVQCPIGNPGIKGTLPNEVDVPGGVEMQMAGQELSISDAKALQSGESSIFIIIDLTYRDIFPDDPPITTFWCEYISSIDLMTGEGRYIMVENSTN